MHVDPLIDAARDHQADMGPSVAKLFCAASGPRGFSTAPYFRPDVQGLVNQCVRVQRTVLLTLHGVGCRIRFGMAHAKILKFWYDMKRNFRQLDRFRKLLDHRSG